MATAGLQHAARLTARRAFATQQRPQLATTKLRPASSPSPLTAHPLFCNTFRRAYADSAASPKPKKKGFRLLRWIWRATYLSAIVGLGYIGYGIYEMRNPPEQPNPDPNKKTLVILGTTARYGPAPAPIANVDRVRQVLAGVRSPS